MGFSERIFSLKSIHGILLFSSWFSLAGRIFASNLSGDFTCHTYPVYKPIDTPEFQGKGKNWTLVPEENPNYADLPWANGEVEWTFMMIGISYGIAIAIGIAFCWIFSKRDSKMHQATLNSADDLKDEEG